MGAGVTTSDLVIRGGTLIDGRRMRLLPTGQSPIVDGGVTVGIF